MLSSDISLECIESIHRKDTSCYTTAQLRTWIGDSRVPAAGGRGHALRAPLVTDEYDGEPAVKRPSSLWPESLRKFGAYGGEMCQCWHWNHLTVLYVLATGAAPPPAERAG